MTAPVTAGQVLAGKYRVDRVLGEGGMGIVVAATDVALERKVAIKFLLPQYAEHAEASVRFMREARAAVKIQSEHIARVIDVGAMENGSPYMVMEFLEGGDLSQVIERRQQLPVAEAVLYVLQACDAIAEAHSYGIVHRDLKPANLFLANQADGSAKVKVLDFGISKSTVVGPESSDVSLTRTSSMMGSPLYMSPEQMRSTKDVDARTDIWALGIILYELLTGKLPFDANSIPELAAKILLESADPITRTDVPEKLKLAISQALQKDPRQRFPSVAEYAMAIAEFAPKQARQNVERISRLLVAAGMSTSQLDLPPSLPPAPALAATTVENEAGGRTGLRAHAGTVADWSNTQGPRTTASSGAGKWALYAGLSVLLVGGGAAAFLFRGVAPVAESTETARLQAPAAVSEPVALAAAAPVVAPVATPPTAATPPTPPEPVATAAAVPEPPAAHQVVAAPPRPATIRPRRVVSAPAPAQNKPTPSSPTKKPSFKDKWGSRK